VEVDRVGHHPEGEVGTSERPAGDPGRTVMEAGHRVEEVGRHGGAAVASSRRLGAVGRGVAERDAHPVLRQALDERRRTRELGG
jgi:hypothetical protein